MAVGERRRRQETFYEAQRRHRRSGWRFSVMSVVAVVVLGLPLSVIVSPIVAAAGLVALDLVDLVTPMPDPLADMGDALDRLSDAGDGGNDASTEGLGAGALAIAVALVVPGVAVMAGAWLCVRRLFLRSGAGALALAAGARPPRPGDVDERQLVNLVEEMAVAAGVPPPRVLVLDADLANAAVVGRSIHDVTLIVPRRLLDDLGRRETGAVVADLLAVAVNGDLRIALVIASVFQTFDLVGATPSAPFSRRTRQALRRVGRLALARGSRRDGAEAQFIATELATVAEFGGPEADLAGGCITSFVQFPFFVASLAFTLTRLIAGGLFSNLAMGALWRRRRLLADATAVEMTRDPDALAQALQYFRVHGASVPAGPWTHLFLVGPGVDQRGSRERYEARMQALREDPRRPGESRRAFLVRRSQEAAEVGFEGTAPAPAGTGGGPSEGHPAVSGGTDLDGFLPLLAKRLEQLGAMGATIELGPARHPPRSRVVVAAASIAGVVLIAIIAVLFLLLLACLAALIYLALLFELLLLAPIVLGVYALIR
jgi:Zn-dependent protease with chaperone function